MSPRDMLCDRYTASSPGVLAAAGRGYMQLVSHMTIMP